ncbi:MAG: hypothetical protein GY816_15645, partial [Cytophagales bacterium]|nr:hypothetical protein [Cytophagales bacterium]
SPELESFESLAPDVEEMEQIEKELKKGTISNIVIDMNERSFIEIDRFSSLTRLLNTTVYVLRFIKRHILGNKPKENNHSLGFSKLEIWLKPISSSGCITSDEMKVAMNLLIFDTQRTHMGQLHNEIQNKLIEKSRYFNLSPFICSDGLIRSASRMKNASLRQKEKFPFLLPNDAPLVRLLVCNIHVRLGHAGIQHTLANLRKEVWIPQGQRTVRRILSECRVCRRHKGGSYKMPLMAPLPKERLMRTKPFQYIGLDYFGPLVVKFNKENTKAWICLFTCCVTRAIHLEPVFSMNTKAFIGCLRRFIARRGQPMCIISDNAPQFLLASDTLKGLFASEPALDDDVFSYFAREGIQWKFITEFAP